MRARRRTPLDLSRPHSAGHLLRRNKDSAKQFDLH